MKGSKWAVLIVLLLVVGVLAVRYGRRAATSSEPLAVAQVRQDSATSRLVEGAVHDASAPAETGSSGLKPQASGTASDAMALKPAEKTETPGPSSGGPEEHPAETAGEADSAANADSRKPEGPLPGSKLKECLRSGRPTMADFGLGTCKWCKMMEPILKQAAQDYWGKANILFIELDKYPDLSREYRIATMPTQIFFDASGKQVDSHMGFLDRAGIDERLSALGATQ